MQVRFVELAKVESFPYTLRYAVRGDLIVVVAVSHQHRAPDYWVDRVST